MSASEITATPALEATMLAHSDQPAPRFADEDLDAHAIGRFAVLRKVGEGGMGAVYAAFDERLARRVAIKLLHGVDHARLLREAQALARLSHPHVVQVYEVGEASGRIFVAMEYVEGPTLAAWRTATPRDAAAILAVYLQAGAGLQAAHASGLVHRDFKPGNVIVGDDGRARVLDFGLARAGDSMTDGEVPRTGGYFGSLTSPLTQTGALMGTPAYMSPEQHAALPLDARSDQFSFCAALYEALYDERPYAGDNVADMTTSMFSGSMRAPRPRPDVPPAVHAAIVRGLAVDPAARWSSMEELLQVLASGQRQSVTVGDIRVWRWFAAGMLVLLLAAATTAIHQANRAGSSPQQDAAIFSVFAGLAMLSVTPWLLRRFPKRRARQLIGFGLIYVLSSAAIRLLLWWMGASQTEWLISESLMLASTHATLALCLRIPALLLTIVPLLLTTAIATIAFGLGHYPIVTAWTLTVGLDLAIWRWYWPVED